MLTGLTVPGACPEPASHGTAPVSTNAVRGETPSSSSSSSLVERLIISSLTPSGGVNLIIVVWRNVLLSALEDVEHDTMIQ